MSIEYAALPPCVTGVTRVEQPSQTLKNVVRIVEKAVMNDRGRGRCNRVFDVVRGMVVCRNMGTVARVVKALDTEPRIELVRMKERFFKEPSAGGWRDAMVCFVVKADLNRHVCELQIAHHDLLTARKGLPGHAVYNRARNAAELLDVMREGTTFFDPPWTGTFSSSTWVCALCVCVCVCVGEFVLTLLARANNLLAGPAFDRAALPLDEIHSDNPALLWGEQGRALVSLAAHESWRGLGWGFHASTRQPLDQWKGVTLHHGLMQKLDLSHSNLRGACFPALKFVWSLQFYLHNNQLTGERVKLA